MESERPLKGHLVCLLPWACSDLPTPLLHELLCWTGFQKSSVMEIPDLPTNKQKVKAMLTAEQLIGFCPLVLQRKDPLLRCLCALLMLQGNMLILRRRADLSTGKWEMRADCACKMVSSNLHGCLLARWDFGTIVFMCDCLLDYNCNKCD